MIRTITTTTVQSARLSDGSLSSCVLDDPRPESYCARWRGNLGLTDALFDMPAPDRARWVSALYVAATSNDTVRQIDLELE